MTLGLSQSQNKANLLGLVPFIPAESSSSSIKGRSSNVNSQETSNILSLQSMQKFYSNQTYSVSLSILNLSG
jgi:hypothetical protein